MCHQGCRHCQQRQPSTVSDKRPMEVVGKGAHFSACRPRLNAALLTCFLALLVYCWLLHYLQYEGPACATLVKTRIPALFIDC
jgi:hypothetical protein